VIDDHRGPRILTQIADPAQPFDGPALRFGIKRVVQRSSEEDEADRHNCRVSTSSRGHVGDPGAGQLPPDAGIDSHHADIIVQVTLFLREADVRTLLTMEDAIGALESAFRDWAEGRADNQPRRRVRAGVFLATMSAALPARGIVGLKAYTSGKDGTRFWVHLYDAATGHPRAVIEADHLGRLRTGAASGLATRYLAHEAASVVALFGAGTQALTQALAMLAVRPIKEIRVVNRNPDRRKAFVDELRHVWSAGQIRETASARDALSGAHVVTTVTSGGSPLFPGTWLEAGQHVNAVGSNWPNRREIDSLAVSRADPIVADDVEAGRVEAGELVLAAADGSLDWTRVASLRDVVAGRVSRSSPDQISLFKSVGLALEDVAVAATILRRAEERGLGEPIPV